MIPQLEFGGIYNYITDKKMKLKVGIAILAIVAFSWILQAAINVNNTVEQVGINSIKADSAFVEIKELKSTISELKSVPKDLEAIKKAIDKQNDAWTDFWKNYDVKKKH